jgi:hypothetical protein
MEVRFHTSCAKPGQALSQATESGTIADVGPSHWLLGHEAPPELYGAARALPAAGVAEFSAESLFNVVIVGPPFFSFVRRK